MKQYDFLVIGGGIAGISFALEAAKSGTVALLSKKALTLSSTAWAQGGIAAVNQADDNLELHIQDTMKSGAGMCNEAAVRSIISEGPERIRALINWGVSFDKEQNKETFHLHQEGGHSRRRIFHKADATGNEIQETLIKKVEKNKSITVYEHANVIDLITTRKQCPEQTSPNTALGAYVLLGPRRIETFLAKKVLMATGGAGKIYLYTSNPDIATGDGIAMSYRAGARVAGMEFFQFHPTCLYHPHAKSFLITEAMRGEGALLKRLDGTRFMDRYSSLGELAPRDIVARAIDTELKSTGDEFVVLDITHRDAQFITSHFPTIYEKCLEFGIDITKEPIPVVPAAHFCCGGIITDLTGRTDIQNLYAAGECAYTGLHGANRLASNSLLEGAVMGHRAAIDACKTLDATPMPNNIPLWDSEGAVDSEEQVIITQNWNEIRQFMWNYVGIVRSNKRLARALRRSSMIQKEITDYYWNFHITSDLLELRNLSLVSHLVIQSALMRKESRGLHYTSDFPDHSDECKQVTIIDPLEQKAKMEL